VFLGSMARLSRPCRRDSRSVVAVRVDREYQ
jgi:hypothetical protein